MKRLFAAHPVPSWARRRRVRWPLGVGLALLLLVAYFGAVRPARVWLAEDVAGPAFYAIETERSERFVLQQPEGRRSVVLAVPRDATPEDVEARTAQWSAPIGSLFVMPALFLIAVFPLRLYWLALLLYHAVLGAVAFVLFYLGLGWFAPAFMLYDFSQTYVAETISLVLPLLLWLAGRRVAQSAESSDDAPSTAPGSEAHLSEARTKP